ncbi:MAG: hypothetical protein PUD83_07370 [Bacteroidales bacterium]|nr:hypothetical protein [Bacteroidales bacterium]
MMVVLTVVGIRNYLPNGEADYPQLFKRLPIGTTVYLRKQSEGEQYPGCVYVYDEEAKTIGSLTKTERCFIELEIPKDMMLQAKIVGHSSVHNCLYIEAENTKGFSVPYIRQIELTGSETAIPLTTLDNKIKLFTSSMKTMIDSLKKDGDASNVDSLLRIAEKYQTCCCQSLDGDTSFSRGEICQELRILLNQYPALKDVYSVIYEQHKDLSTKEEQTNVFRKQYGRIYERAMLKEEHGSSFLEDYIEKLTFLNGGQLTTEIVQNEILSLSSLLAKELCNNYVMFIKTEESFAHVLYSLNYSLNGIYILFTRRIKLEYLQSLLANLSDNVAADHTTRLKGDNTNPDESISKEELTFLIHPSVTQEQEKQKIHGELVNLVRNNSIVNICDHLKSMAKSKRILLPANPGNAMTELQRLGMPGTDKKGFSYKNFQKYYKK